MTVSEPMSPELEYLRDELKRAVAQQIAAPEPHGFEPRVPAPGRRHRRSLPTARRTLALVATIAAAATLAVAGASAAGIDWLPSFSEPEVMPPSKMDDGIEIRNADGTPGGMVGSFLGYVEPMPLGSTVRATSETGSLRNGNQAYVTHERVGMYGLEIPVLAAEAAMPMVDVVLMDRSTGRSLELPDPETGERWIVLSDGLRDTAEFGPGFVRVPFTVRRLPAMSPDGLECFRARYEGSYALQTEVKARQNQNSAMMSALNFCRKHPGVLPEFPDGYSQSGISTYATLNTIGRPESLTGTMALRVSVALLGGSSFAVAPGS